MSRSPEPATIADRSISAAGWMLAGTAFRAFLQVAAQVTFARIIGPEHFGIFLLAGLAIALGAMFADVGMSYALIQRREVTERDIRQAFTWQVVVALAVTTILALCAPWVAAWFEKPEVGPVLAVTSLVLLLNAAGIPAMNLLRRDLNYKAIQFASLASYLVGYVLIGIPAVMLGAGVWGPAIAWLAQATLNSILLYAQKRHPVSPLLRGDDNVWFAGYSATFFATNLTNWALMNLDRAVLGRVADAASVGLYATPYNLLNNPTMQILNTIQSVLFSAGSRLQESPADMRRAYLAVLGVIGVFVFPVFAGLSAASEALIAVLYGPAWAAAADVVCALAWAMPLYLLWAISTPILWNTNQRTLEFKWQLPLLPLWAIAAWICARQGIVMLAWAIVGMQALRAAITTVPAARALGLSLLDCLWTIRYGVAIGLLVAVAVHFLVSSMAGGSAGLILAAAVTCGFIVWAVALRILSSQLPVELNTLIHHVSKRLPDPIGPFFRRTLFPESRQ